jgi:hypothetical protein
MTAVLLLLSMAAPGKAAEDGYSVSFSSQGMADAINRIEQSLEDYRALSEVLALAAGVTEAGDIGTEAVRFEVDGQDLSGLETIFWDVQNIGFPNWLRYVRGCLASKDLEILQLERELAGLKGASADSLDRLDEEMLQFRIQFEREYLSGDNWVD